MVNNVHKVTWWCTGIVLLSIFLLATALPLHAQYQASTTVTLQVIPEFPKPNEVVRIRIQTFSFNVSQAQIRWFVNGEEQHAFAGMREINITAGAAGSTTNVRATISTGGTTIEQSIIIRPQPVQLVWESVDGYAPVLYRGKKRVTAEGFIRVVAFPYMEKPGGGFYKPSELAFEWTQNGLPKENASGIGRQAYVFANNFINQRDEVEVRVSVPGTGDVAYNRATITPSPPELVLYTGAAGDQVLKQDSALRTSNRTVFVTAIPYFFSIPHPRHQSMSYTWEVNGEKIAVNQNENQVAIEVPESAQGVLTVRLSAERPNTLFQIAEAVGNVEITN